MGILEDFEDQQVPLTQPLRALTYSTGRSGPSNYDYEVVAGLGRNGSSAWKVPAMTMSDAASPYSFESPVPMLPLNNSWEYSLTAWVRLVSTAPGASAQLWLGLYEESMPAGPGPSYGRIAYFNSTILTPLGTQGDPEVWVHPSVTGGDPELRAAARGKGRGLTTDWTMLEIKFKSPAWASFADLRPIVVSPAGSTDYAVFDDWLFSQE